MITGWVAGVGSGEGCGSSRAEFRLLEPRSRRTALCWLAESWGAEQDEVVRAINSVAGGEAIFGPSVARRILDYFRLPPPATPVFPELTVREREVLDLVAAGHPNSVIARRLFLSPKTVSNHVSNIFAKLQVADRAQAIVRARRAGLGSEDD